MNIEQLAIALFRAKKAEEQAKAPAQMPWMKN